MKYMYFLQTLRDVPLGYNFSIYTYGPFDPDVLSDLDTVEAIGAVKSTTVSFAGGYGYRIQATEGSIRIKQESDEFLTRHKGDIEWLIREFGGLNSADLELASTVVYVDQEFKDMGIMNDSANLIGVVNEIKPHFTRVQVEDSFNALREKGLLTSLAA
jgi:hypothetical protein